VGVFVFVVVTVSRSAQEDFFQTDWSGGPAADSAVHPTDQAGWDKYESRDENVRTMDLGEIKLTPITSSSIDTTDTDFSQGTFNDSVVSGTGDSASIQLTSSVTDP
jgi:hypothetical protein